MSDINKQGLIVTSEFIESDSITNQFSGGSATYTPTTGTNSCANAGYWDVPEDAVGGTSYHIRVTVEYNGFDRSNTSGTFNIFFQGANRSRTEGWKWAGSNYPCGALNGVNALSTVVLSSTRGVYTYEADFVVPSDWLTTYSGSNIGLRSDYSNGTASITIKNISIIPTMYSTSISSPPYTSIRVGDSHITAHEFIEW